MPAGDPRLFAVAGDPVAQSLSPAMHNAAFAAEVATQLAALPPLG